MGNYLSSKKPDETASLYLGDEDASVAAASSTIKRNQENMLSMDSYTIKKNRTNILEYYRLYRQRLPYLIEDFFGINMNYYMS